MEETQRVALRGAYERSGTVIDGGNRPSQAVTHASYYWERPAHTLVTSPRSDEGIVVGRQLPEGESRAQGGWALKRIDINRGQNRSSIIYNAQAAPAPTITHAAFGKNVWQIRESEVPEGPTSYGAAKPYEKFENRGVRITLQEAAVLQSFPPDFPFQGVKTRQFQQVGNAIPVALARAILATFL
jgi:site-specific DNA-cytosine methylase